MREFLFGNIQIGVTSQRLLFKASCMELETPHETRYYLHYQAKIQRERERESKKGLMKSHIQTYAAYSSSAWCYSLYLCLSLFLLSLSLLCVYLLSLCVFFLFIIFFFFRVPLQFIEELRNNFSLFLLKTFIFFHKYYLNIFFFLIV